MTPAPTIVVAISRQLGSGGAFVGQTAARRLGFKYLDHEVLQRAAAALGCEDDDLARLEERATGFWESSARMLSLGGLEGTYVPPAWPPIYADDLFQVESRIIREVASREDAVIVGRGSSHVLGDHPGLISVFIHAPRAWRIARVGRIYGLEDPEAAVDASDRDRARFLRSVSGREWNDATRYHLTLNTAVIGLDAAAELVTNLVAARVALRRAAPAAKDGS
jgi:cytidylate kinase